MIKKKQVYNILVLFFAGIVVGVIIKYFKSFTFNFEVSVFDVFALFVTAALAWWVAEKLEKDSAKERCEKDIIIEKLKSMDGLVEKLNKEIEEDDLVILTSVTSIINSIDAHSERIMEQLKKHYPSVRTDKEDVNYMAELELLDNLCTDDADGGMASLVEKGLTVCQYTPERKDEISTCTNQLSDKIFNLEIFVNRA